MGPTPIKPRLNSCAPKPDLIVLSHARKRGRLESAREAFCARSSIPSEFTTRDHSNASNRKNYLRQSFGTQCSSLYRIPCVRNPLSLCICKTHVFPRSSQRANHQDSRLNNFDSLRRSVTLHSSLYITLLPLSSSLVSHFFPFFFFLAFQHSILNRSNVSFFFFKYSKFKKYRKIKNIVPLSIRTTISFNPLSFLTFTTIYDRRNIDSS